ncbi:hypothetical protein BGZ58_001160 [Dissophora ornata]|nr:hypothetical protein BGZ58_001160 [Dissophora ornata]
MARAETEHRNRECELYSKIIELQIENANLKGEKETFHRIILRRDRMIIELRTQLQVMEYVCRENDFKVDIELVPEEAVRNWSFKESDEVYQRILLTMQDLLRVGSKCIEENIPTGRSSSQRLRSTRSMSISTASKTSSEYGRGAQPLMIQGQETDSLLLKGPSRPESGNFDDTHTLLQAWQESHAADSNNSRSIVSHVNLAEIDARVELNGRRALDRGDDRSNLFRATPENCHYRSEDDDSDDSDMIDDSDDEGQESEFEELGEDMIKYVELQSCVGPPRREARSSSVSKMLGPGNGSAAGTPEMSTTVLMKNLWNISGARRNAAATPLQHPFHYPQQHHQGRITNRSSSESFRSNNSAMDDYFMKGQRPSMESNSSGHHAHAGAAAPSGVGLGLIGVGRSLDQISMERFLVAPPTCALPPSPLLYSIPSYPVSSSSMNRSPLSTSSSATFPSYSMSMMDCGISHPPPMMPLPPLPDSPKFSYREHTKKKLLESKRPTHGRTSSHGFVIENVGQFLKRKTHVKTLTRDWMHRGQRRRDSL